MMSGFWAAKKLAGANCRSMYVLFLLNRMPAAKKPKYTVQAVEFALDAAKRGISISQAAARYGVPAGTLRDKLRNKYRKEKKRTSEHSH